MDLLGHGFYYQDWYEGYEFQTLGRTITETDILNFVGVSGMTEELFTSLDYLEKHTDFPARLVPGALVFSMAEGLVIPATISRTGQTRRVKTDKTFSGSVLGTRIRGKR